MPQLEHATSRRFPGLLAMLGHPTTVWTILALSLLLTAWAWHAVDGLIHRQAAKHFERRTTDMEQVIAERLLLLETVLQCGAGLFNASAEVTRDAWRWFFTGTQIQEFLADLGYQVRSVADSAAMQDGRPFQLVLLDLAIPGGRGGQEILAELLSLNPLVKALALSGHADELPLKYPASFGFVGAIAKPFRINHLAALIRQILPPPAEPAG